VRRQWHGPNPKLWRMHEAQLPIFSNASIKPHPALSTSTELKDATANCRLPAGARFQDEPPPPTSYPKCRVRYIFPGAAPVPSPEATSLDSP
jgi:hypothetical protein